MAIAKDHAGFMDGAVEWRDFVKKNNPTIVQIGSHDGVLGEEYGFHELLESIEKFRLVLVEPLSPYFDNLIIKDSFISPLFPHFWLICFNYS